MLVFRGIWILLVQEWYLGAKQFIYHTLPPFWIILGIFGWLIFLCNHLLYIKIQRKIMNHPTTIWQNNSSITYIHPPPQAFLLPWKPGFVWVSSSIFTHPSPTKSPVCSLLQTGQFETTPLWPARRPYGSWTSPGRNPSRWTGFVDWEDPEKTWVSNCSRNWLASPVLILNGPPRVLLVISWMWRLCWSSEKMIKYVSLFQF